VSDGGKTMNLYEIVMKLVGPVCPTGDNNTDQERLKNMKALIELVDRLLFDIGEVDQKDVSVPVEELEAGRYRMMIPVEISTTGGLLLDRRDGLHGYSLEDYPNAKFFKGW